MTVKTIVGSSDFAEYLRGKKGTFFLSLSNTDTAKIEGITQAGIPGMIHLTPTLDAEFLCTGEVKSLKNIATTQKGVPTPGLITRAVHLLRPFNTLALLDLGLEVKPIIDYFPLYDFGIVPSGSINTGANINAMELFEKGLEFAQEYSFYSDYIILGESVPSGTTTALATALALGYDAREKFSSSFKNAPSSIKEHVVDTALSSCGENEDLFEKLSRVSDNMLMFNAGFVLGLRNRKITTVLAGGTQMAALLLVINSILKHTNQTINSHKLALCTTKWVYEDPNSDIKGLLEMLDFKINAYYVDFDFSLTQHPALKLYDEGEAKEGVGAGGALMYACLNGITKEQITRKVESFLQ
ncbi:MAG: TIGR00303 family protein [Sulfuricurvum sp.]|nr:TIGR00303 family protein [Sulfuricurvum sp.]